MITFAELSIGKEFRFPSPFIVRDDTGVPYAHYPVYTKISDTAYQNRRTGFVAVLSDVRVLVNQWHG